MRILVTGASGFTGRALCAALHSAQQDVIGVTFSNTPDTPWTNYAVDLRDATAVQALFEKTRPTAVVHLAARSFVDDDDLLGFYDHNVITATNLFEAARDHQVTRFIAASSANVYGVPAAEHLPLSESAPLAPVNHYGASKLAMEHIARTYNDDFALTITRPFNYTGVGQAAHFLVPKLAAHFAQKKAAIDLGNLDVARDYTSIDDVVRAYMMLLHCDAAAGQTVNICSSRVYSLLQLLDLFTQISGHTIEVRSQPHFVRRHDIPVLSGDYSQLQQLCGWEPQQSIPDLLKSML